MPRLFVAVWPPDAVVEDLAQLPRQAAPGVSWTKAHRLHITLRFLGECDQDEVLGALTSSSFPNARVTLGPTAQRLGRGVLMLPAEGVDELAASVGEATRFIGDPLPDHPFVGHMTVARFRRRQPSADWPQLNDTFDVSQISLVESTPWGEYADVATFPLR